jgi:hypothetical protein
MAILIELLAPPPEGAEAGFQDACVLPPEPIWLASQIVGELVAPAVSNTKGCSFPRLGLQAQPVRPAGRMRPETPDSPRRYVVWPGGRLSVFNFERDRSGWIPALALHN